jgi:hypothetical protein
VSVALDVATFPAPRFGTPRDPAMPTMGPRCAGVAAMIGSPLLPWQAHVADVALEYRPADAEAVAMIRRAAIADAREAMAAGDYVAARAAVSRAKRARVPWRYKIVVVLVPRQAGKTVLLRAVAVDRAMTSDGADLFTTAQLGKDAVARWHDTAEAVTGDGSPLADLVAVRQSQGSESLTFPNGAALRPFAPTPKSIHGWSPPFVGVDEGWAFDAAQGEALDAAIRGAMLTRTDQQLWVISAAGTAESEWLLGLVERGRAEHDDPTSDMAYFEWSVPDDVDLASDEAAMFHPALGQLITLDGWRAERRALSPGTFARNMANRWTKRLETVVDLDLFAGCGDPTLTAPGQDVALAYDIAFDRSEAAIVAAWRDDTGRACWRVVQSAPGTRWLVPAVHDLARDWTVRAIGADDGGPAKSATDDLGELGVHVETTGARDFATATGDVLGAIENRDDDGAPDPQLVHDGDPAWEAEMAGAALRRMGQAQAWDRAQSAVPIPRLIAATVALRLYDHGAPAMPDPFVYVPGE